MNYREICFQVQAIARSAGTFIREEQKKITNNSVDTKSFASLVTYVDKTAEEKIISDLRKLIPQSGFVAEEGSAQSNNEDYTWFVDPLDGTTNYIHGITPYSVSIGLAEKGKMVLGVVYEIGANEMFFAWKDSKSYCNDNPIRVAKRTKSEDTLIATGLPYDNFSRTEDYYSAIKQLMQETRGIRRLGSAAVDICYVASGRFDAFWEHGLHAWDVAAATFILEQAGGKTTDFNGGNNWLFGGDIISASQSYFEKFYGIINSHLGEKV